MIMTVKFPRCYPADLKRLVGTEITYKGNNVGKIMRFELSKEDNLPIAIYKIYKEYEYLYNELITLSCGFNMEDKND